MKFDFRFSRFSYQAFARYLQGNCDSEQEVEEQVDERMLVSNMKEYLRAKWADVYDLRYDEHTPEELKSAGAGKPRKLDLVGFSKARWSTGQIGMVLEAKMIVDTNRSWTDEIVEDLVRVSCVKKGLVKRAKRFVLVAGQEGCWEYALRQRGGLLPSIFPMESVKNWKSQLLFGHFRNDVAPIPEWLNSSDEHKRFYELVRPHLPQRIRIELVGLSKSSRGEDEQKDAGITVRLWRVIPQFAPVSASVDQVS